MVPGTLVQVALASEAILTARFQMPIKRAERDSLLEDFLLDQMDLYDRITAAVRPRERPPSWEETEGSSLGSG